jgi:NAD(P)-dependent dehydrogenase (short-subunit alcohol dehydrogenase family)
MHIPLPSRSAVMIGAGGFTLAGAAVGVGAALIAREAWNSFRLADIRDHVVLITGSSRGLGLAMAREFAAVGCRIVICARDADELRAAEADLRQRGADVLAITCNVSNDDEVHRMVEQATQHFGRIDILVNNAGIIQVGPIESQTIEDFRNAMDVMFWGVVYPTLAVLPQMKARGYGRIANITSIGGKISVPHLVPYGAAKFAAVGFSEGIHAELKKDGINVTTVVPGLMRTGSHLNAHFKGEHEKEYSWFALAATNPLSAIGARRAARSVVNAVRRGRAEVVLGLPAKLAVLAHGIAPGITSDVLGLSNRVMPGTGASQKELFTGRESETAVTRSPLTALGRRAAREYNQLPEVRHTSS